MYDPVFGGGSGLVEVGVHKLDYVGPTLESYLYFKVVDSKTKDTSISKTVEFMHSYLTQPTLTPVDRILHAVRLLACAL